MTFWLLCPNVCYYTIRKHAPKRENDCNFRFSSSPPNSVNMFCTRWQLQLFSGGIKWTLDFEGGHIKKTFLFYNLWIKVSVESQWLWWTKRLDIFSLTWNQKDKWLKKGSRIAPRLSLHILCLLRVYAFEGGRRAKEEREGLHHNLSTTTVAREVFLLDCCAVYLQFVYQENVQLLNQRLSRVNDKTLQRFQWIKIR